MSDAIVVSNRGPLSFRAGPDGSLVPVPAGGGLASTLHRLLAGSGTTWASVTMGAPDREAVARGLMHEDGLDLLPVVVDEQTYRQAYDVVANTTLWYCHHHLFDLPHRPRFDRHWREAWEGYRAYNRAMSDVVAARAADGAAVFVQDYHFSLLGRMLAEARPDLRTVHFLHTPFAAPDMLAVLPDDAVAELLDGMAGYAACGFHCHQWEAGFTACYARRPGAPPRRPSWPRSAPTPTCSRRRRRRPSARRRPTRCGPKWAGAASSPAATAWSRRRTSCGGCWPSRSCCARIPEWRGEVVHLAFAYPSRQGLAEYLAYGADVEHTAERINHAFGAGPGSEGWTPIVLSVADDRARSLAALTLSDVLLVNPVRDGLNLVAKEGPLLNTNDGVLVLSRQAGAWEELALGGGGALGVNPFDVAGTADALHAALTMDAGGAFGARRGAARRRAGPDVGRLVGRPAGGCSGLTGGLGTGFRGVREQAQQRDRADRALHREVGGGGHCGWALRVDGGDPHRDERPPVRGAQIGGGGEGGQVAHVVAEGSHRPQRRDGALVVLGHQRAHHRALVDIERGTQLALVAALVHQQAARRRLAHRERRRPSPCARGRGASGG